MVNIDSIRHVMVKQAATLGGYTRLHLEHLSTDDRFYKVCTSIVSSEHKSATVVSLCRSSPTFKGMATLTITMFYMKDLNKP